MRVVVAAVVIVVVVVVIVVVVVVVVTAGSRFKTLIRTIVYASVAPSAFLPIDRLTIVFMVVCLCLFAFSVQV